MGWDEDEISLCNSFGIISRLMLFKKEKEKRGKKKNAKKISAKPIR